MKTIKTGWCYYIHNEGRVHVRAVIDNRTVVYCKWNKHSGWSYLTRPLLYFGILESMNNLKPLGNSRYLATTIPIDWIAGIYSIERHKTWTPFKN